MRRISTSLSTSEMQRNMRRQEYRLNKLNNQPDASSQKTKIECPIYPDRCYEAIKEFIEKKESCQNELAGFMNKENFLSIWNKICENNPSNLNGRETAFHIWFDGLKIIRAIHAVQAIL